MTALAVRSEKLDIRVTPDVLAELDEVARRAGLTRSDVSRAAIDRFLHLAVADAG